jgi:hypothetical protein
MRNRKLEVLRNKVQMKKILMCGLLAMMAAPMFADDDSDNCRAWNGWTGMEGGMWRLGYVMGFADGLKAVSMDAALAMAPKRSDGTLADRKDAIRAFDISTKVNVQHFAFSATNGENFRGVDEICKRPENAGISIMSAFQAFAMQVSGKTQAEIDKYLSDARALAAQVEKLKSK